MHEAVTVTLIILAAALLRRSLLTDPDASPGVRSDGRDNDGFTALAPVTIKADSPHPAKSPSRKR